MPRPIPPFYENWDDTHCFQCSLRAVIEHFEPAARLNWDDMDALTNKIPGKGTWGYRTAVNMVERGYDIVSINNADLKDYLELGIYEGMVKHVGREAADKSRENSDHDQAHKDLKIWWKLYEQGQIIKHLRVPTQQDILDFLNDGYLVYSWVNSKVLNGKPGYSGHFVLIYDADEATVTFHDSGAPGVPARHLPWAEFIKATTTPTDASWSITAYRKKTA